MPFKDKRMQNTYDRIRKAKKALLKPGLKATERAEIQGRLDRDERAMVEMQQAPKTKSLSSTKSYGVIFSI